MIGPVEVPQELLAAFARLHGGEQHDPAELGCRVVQAETDEGHPTEGEILEVYARPDDPAWQREMDGLMGGPGPHDVVFFKSPLVASAQVVKVLRGMCFRRLVSSREDYEAVRDLLGPLGIT